MATEFLRVIEGQASGTEIEIDEVFVIGRSAEGHGSLGGDAEISREHAQVTRSGSGELLIEDLGSTNGTSVNGQRISGPTTLRPGDKVKVGTTTISVEGAAPGAGTTAVRPVGQPTAVRPVGGQPTVQRSGLSNTMLRMAKQPEAFEEITFVEEDDPPGRHPTIIAIGTILTGILIGAMIVGVILD